MTALSMFGAMGIWMLIFVTHLFFSRTPTKREKPKYKLLFYQLGSLIGTPLIAVRLLTKEFPKGHDLRCPFALVVVGLQVFNHKRKIPPKDATGVGIKCRCLSYAKSGP